MKKKLPKSIRKFIRREKARIRREVLSSTEQEQLISNLYLRFFPRPSVESEDKLKNQNAKIKITNQNSK